MIICVNKRNIDIININEFVIEDFISSKNVNNKIVFNDININEIVYSDDYNNLTICITGTLQKLGSNECSGKFSGYIIINISELDDNIKRGSILYAEHLNLTCILDNGESISISDNLNDNCMDDDKNYKINKVFIKL